MCQRYQNRFVRASARIVAISLVAPWTARAGTYYWTPRVGNYWDVSPALNFNWTDSSGSVGMPKAPTDGAYFTRTPDSICYYNTLAPSGSLTIGNLDLGVDTTLAQNTQTLVVASAETIENGTLNIVFTSGSSAPLHQVGTPSADGTLVVGAAAGGHASVYLGSSSTTAEALYVYGHEQIGSVGAGGDFEQIGGTHTVSGTAATLSVGWDGANSTYGLSAGSLWAGSLIVGDGDPGGSGGGSGQFTQSGGLCSANLTLGQRNPGSYTLGGGTVSAPSMTLGVGALGQFTQNAGSVSSVVLQVGSGANGTYSLNSGTLSGGYLYIGGTQPGQFSQSGSTTNTLSSVLKVQNGEYDLNSGSLNVTGTYSTDGEMVYGRFIQNGGTNTTAWLDVDSTDSYGPGFYNLAGGSLTVNGDLSIGTGLGGGDFSQSSTSADSSLTVTGTLHIGFDGDQRTVGYGLTGGTMTATNVRLDSGTIEQLGGTATIPDNLTIGTGTVYDLLGGTLVSTAANLTSGGINVGSGATAHVIFLGGDGTMQVNAGGNVLFDTPAGQNAIDAVVQNGGTVALVDGSDIQLSGTVNNNSGGTFDLRTDAGFNGYGTFNNNAGATFQKSAGWGTSTVSGIALTNSGTIDGLTGVLDLNVTGTNAGAIDSEGGATVKLGGTWTLNDGTSFGGTGTTNLYGTAHLMADARATTAFQIAPGGSLQGSGYTLTSTYGLDLQDGSSASSPSPANPLTITSMGAGMTMTGYVSVNSVVLNAQSSTSQLSGDSGYGNLSCGSNTTINNSGN